MVADAGGRPDRLLADRVQRFLFAHVVTFTGTTLSYVVLPVLVFRLTGSAGITSAVVALQIGPYLVFGLLAGQRADRGDRQKLMVRCDLVNAVLFASVPVAATFGRLTVGHLLLVAGGAGVTFVFFDAANFGALPALIGRDKIVEAMSLQWSIDGIVQVAGPAFGGLLVAVAAPELVLGLDALTYLASATLLGSIQRPFRTITTDGAGRVAGAMWDGARFVWRNPLVRALTVLGIGTSFTYGLVLGLLVPFAVEALGLPDDGASIGLLYSAGALGGVLGAWGLPRIVRVAPVATVTHVSLAVAGALVVVLALQKTLAGALLLILAVDGTLYLIMINGIAYRQRVTPDDLQGRVNILARMVAISGQPVGAVLGGVVATALGVRTAMAIGAAGVLLSAALGAAGPLRLRGPTTEQPAAANAAEQ